MTAHPSALFLSPYQRKHRIAAHELLVSSFHVHTHLDWFDVEDWLATSGAPIRVAARNGRLSGLMGVSAPLDGASWLRIAAVSDYQDTGSILLTLWEDLKPELRALGVHQVAVLLLRDWPERYLPRMGFHYLEDIVTLRRSDSREPVELTVDGCTVRTMRAEDMSAVVETDHTAFQPPWQMGGEELRRAEESAAWSTVAVSSSGEILGYQMTTLYFDGAHLARLAVLPQVRSRGIGRMLVSSMLRYFWRRGVYGITVNTQESNIASQRLYTRLGFERTGYDLPVWVADLD
ncbi:MAG: GNAT family N-acetyltransferase [Anaerolineae bacterium]